MNKEQVMPHNCEENRIPRTKEKRIDIWYICAVCDKTFCYKGTEDNG